MYKGFNFTNSQIFCTLMKCFIRHIGIEILNWSRKIGKVFYISLSGHSYNPTFHVIKYFLIKHLTYISFLDSLFYISDKDYNELKYIYVFKTGL